MVQFHRQGQMIYVRTATEARRCRFPPRGYVRRADRAEATRVKAVMSSSLQTSRWARSSTQVPAELLGRREQGRGKRRPGRRQGDRHSRPVERWSTKWRPVLSSLTWTRTANGTFSPRGGRGRQGQCVLQIGNEPGAEARAARQPGEEFTLFLEPSSWPTWADRAPNAGSQRSSRASRGEPDRRLPFTTLTPVLGVVEAREQEGVRCRRHPGLSRRHKGAGLGSSSCATWSGRPLLTCGCVRHCREPGRELHKDQQRTGALQP